MPSHVARAHAPWLPAGSVVSTPPLVATVQLNTGMYWTYVEEAPPLKEARLHAACAQLSASTQLNAQTAGSPAATSRFVDPRSARAAAPALCMLASKNKKQNSYGTRRRRRLVSD